MYDVYIGAMLLPVTPQRIETEIRGKSETIELVNGGEASMIRPAGLAEVELTALLPQARHAFARYVGDFIGPQEFLNYFEKLKAEAIPFRLIICRRKPDGGALFDTNLAVYMEDHRVTEDAGNGLDLSVRLKLRQYVEYRCRQAEIDGETTGAPIVIEDERPGIGNPAADSALTAAVKKAAEKVKRAAKAADAKAVIAQVEKIVGRELSLKAAKKSNAGAVRLISRR